MNLRVDLLNDDERRSANIISTKSVVRMASVVVPIILLLVGATVLVGNNQIKGQASMLAKQWEGLAADKELAGREADLAKEALDLSGELTGWRSARREFHKQLFAIQEVVPENLQLLQLRLSHTIDKNKENTGGHNYAMTLAGLASGADAEAQVGNLSKQLQSHPGLAGLIEEAAITFRREPGENKHLYSFTIEAKYKFLEFAEP